MSYQLYVNISNLKHSSDDFSQYADRLKKLRDRLEDVCAGLTCVGAGYENLKKSIKSQINELDEQQRKMKKYGQTIQTITKLYQSAENNIVESAARISSLEDITEMVKEELKDVGEEVDKWIRELEQTIDDLERYTVLLITKAYHTVFGFEGSTDDCIGWILTREQHYDRNSNMPIEDLPQSPSEAADLGWDDSVASNCHQFTAGDQPNEKWVSPDGKYEVIFDSSGRIVTAPEDYGTYNYCSPNDDPVGHAKKDVIPWIVFGNSEDDETWPLERLYMLVFGGS
ncbi:MAG: methyl-accepting chemotaxis protein [Lachnospiraceae bacterium]|nr:methyl-accepting chemotaxis protein [Lachnospiraceae bacterium]